MLTLDTMKIINFMECAPRFLWHIIDYSFVLGLKQKKHSGSCVIRIGGIGDMILSIPLLSGLSSSGRETTIVCEDKNKCIEFILKKHVSNIIYYNKKKFKGSPSYRRRLLRSLRLKGFDEVIQSGISRQQGGADVLLWACNANKSFGFNPRKWNKCEISISNKWFHTLVDGHYNEIHEIERMEMLAKTVGCNPGEHLTKNKSNNNGKFIVCVAASSPVREWGIDNFINLSRIVRKLTGFLPVFIGEKKDLSKIKCHIDFEHINLIGETSFFELYELISNSNFIITNDSGPMHIGVILNVPTIAIVSGGEYNSYCNYPEKYRENILTVSNNDKSCLNCGWNCIYKESDNYPFPCLSSISVDDVILAIKMWPKFMEFLS